MNLESKQFPELQSYEEEEPFRSWSPASFLFLVLVGLIIGAAVYFK